MSRFLYRTGAVVKRYAACGDLCRGELVELRVVRPALQKYSYFDVNMTRPGLDGMDDDYRVALWRRCIVVLLSPCPKQTRLPLQ